MLRHMTDRRALLRKLENTEAFPMVALQALRELRAELDAVEAEAINRARELGASLEDIAEAMEITRQGVAYKLKALSGNGDTGDGDGEPEEPAVVTADPEAEHKAEREAELSADPSEKEQPDEIVDVRQPDPLTRGHIKA